MINKEPQLYDELVKKHSDAIRAARVLCIFFMCYVHVHIIGVSDTVQLFVREILGRSSVPLLSVISGLLMVGYFRKPLKQVYISRFQSLMLPAMFWGALGWSVFYVLGDVDGFSINEIIPLWAKGKMIHLAFLRDLFVLVLLTPAIIWLMRRTPLALALFVVIGFWAPIEPLMLRPQILPFYAFGLYWATYGLPTVKPHWMDTVATILSFSALAMLIMIVGAWIGGTDGVEYHIDNLVLRPMVALVFWYFACAVARSRLMPLIKRIEPAIFLLFLSHYPLARILTGAYDKSGLQIDTVFWLAVPVICLAVAIIGKWVMSHRLMPAPASVLISGK